MGVASHFNGDISSEFTFYFEKQKPELTDTKPDEKALIHVSLDDDLPVIKVNVDLDSLPNPATSGELRKGFEVTANFILKGMQNDKTFYTDSNGLEMQKRILNYRPTWNISDNYADSNENITANFYPINSAISMKDSKSDKVFTVMNDRPQAGSSLSDGSIELMQSRRIPSDDGRGMGEAVNETDSTGEGIRVSADYYVQIFNSKQEKSVQRLVQHKVDDVAQYFFNFKLSNKAEMPVVQSTLSQDLADAGLKDTVKYVVEPLSQNSILLRFTNLADKYDGPQTNNLDV
jgi:hypothetical protein